MDEHTQEEVAEQKQEAPSQFGFSIPTISMADVVDTSMLPSF